MVSRVATVAFHGVETLPIDVQVQLGNGMPGFSIVGLPDKAVGESRERVRSALSAMGLALPPKRITVNLSPADVVKEGSHYDLPIALAILAAMGAVSQEDLDPYIALGELALDGQLVAVSGVLPAAIGAASRSAGVICPAACGREAAWSGEGEVLAPSSLLALINHFKGSQVLSVPEAGLAEEPGLYPDLADIKGQETAKRALEIAAAGGHNMLMSGPPGSGKSMLAARLPGILPPLEPTEALEISMIRSVAGELDDGRISRRRPFRDPHHSGSMPALIGGGIGARPGEVSLAHCGVLFLDELAEFPRGVLDALRQPIETGRAVISRANRHITYPASFQLIAAMNPCRCGYLSDPERACARAPTCARDYQARISGPLLDRFDIGIEVPPVSVNDLTLPPPRESSADVATRVITARQIQKERYYEEKQAVTGYENARADGDFLMRIATPDAAGQAILAKASEAMRLSARGYHRILRVARTLADLDGETGVHRVHIAEAVSYRRSSHY